MPRTGKRRKRVPWTCLVPDMTAVARGRPSSAGARPPAHTVGCRRPSRCVGHPRRRAIGTWISLTSWEAWGRGGWVAWLAPPALKRQRRVLASVKAFPKPGCAATSLGRLPRLDTRLYSTGSCRTSSHYTPSLASFSSPFDHLHCPREPGCRLGCLVWVSWLSWALRLWGPPHAGLSHPAATRLRRQVRLMFDG